MPQWPARVGTYLRSPLHTMIRVSLEQAVHVTGWRREAGWYGSSVLGGPIHACCSDFTRVLAKGCFESRLWLEARAVPATGQSSNHSGAKDKKMVEIAREHLNPDDFDRPVDARPTPFRVYESLWEPPGATETVELRGRDAAYRAFSLRLWRLFMIRESERRLCPLSGKSRGRTQTRRSKR